MAEQVFFQDPSAYVSNARIVLSNVTYPTAQISSVRPWTQGLTRAALVWGIVFLVVSVLMLLPIAAISSGAGAALLWFFTLGGIASGVLLVVVGARQPKCKYWIILSTAGRDIQAVGAIDQRWAMAVLSAINQAIVARG